MFCKMLTKMRVRYVIMNEMIGQIIDLTSDQNYIIHNTPYTILFLHTLTWYKTQ